MRHFEHLQGTELHNLMVKGQDRLNIITTIYQKICQGWGFAGNSLNNWGQTEQTHLAQCPKHKNFDADPQKKGVHPTTSVVLGVCPLSTTEGSRTLLFSLVVSYSQKILCVHFEKEVSLPSTTSKLGWVKLVFIKGKSVNSSRNADIKMFKQ